MKIDFAKNRESMGLIENTCLKQTRSNDSSLNLPEVTILKKSKCLIRMIY